MQSKEILKELAENSRRHKKRMKNIKREAKLEEKRFPFQLIGMGLTILFTITLNDYIKINYSHYWLNNPWIPITAIIFFPIGLFLSFKLPGIFIK